MVANDGFCTTFSSDFCSCQPSDVDHVGRSILKSSELRFDRFDLLSLLMVHNSGLQDLERL